MGMRIEIATGYTSKLNNDNNATGLGLSVVKKIVDLYSGQIRLESKLNKGTTIFFTLKK